MPKAAIFLSLILVSSLFLNNSYGFFSGDIPQKNSITSKSIDFEKSSGIISITPFSTNPEPTQRYLIFGSGSLSDVSKSAKNIIYSVETQDGFFSVGLLSENKKSKLESQGYHVLKDFKLDFHASDIPEISQIGEITGSGHVSQNYNLTGSGIKIAIVDTGVDFSNPDIQHSLARDKNNVPIMFDADGQGIILTNATFAANIDKNNILRNYTKSIPENVTSDVYRTKKGVFLNIEQGGEGTILQVYNSFFPQSGLEPIFNGTLADDMKIGQNHRDYIVSKSGIYRLGVMYQGSLDGAEPRIQVVPVLVVDSAVSGQYDTIIPDMSTSWEDFTRFDLKSDEKPNYDFDFTDETPIKIGSGKEFLIYDFDDDGRLDYSAGTVGAHVLDLYGVITKKTTLIDKSIRAINATVLEPMDHNGEYFGVMTDFSGHGTASTASITSQGIQEYDIYNNTKKYKIKGVAPGAEIIPIKALWFGDTVYAWLWAAGFDNDQSTWIFQGKPRVDIISNSWGVSNFPTLQYAPGLDILSLVLSVLVVPNSLSDNYPGVTVVSSAGNSGHGYGTMGMPNAAPFGISVGATTNNVFVGYGPFQDQPRFGNSTSHRNEIVDFSSRGPGIIGDPKPDLMSIGAHSFTPSSVTKMEKDSKKEPFSLFGGTSMAAPLVSGSVALLMESLQKQVEYYDPFRIKNILMSTATDIQNDPLTQGSGLVNVNDAIKFVNGEEEIFAVYNDQTFTNIKNVLRDPINSVNSSAIGLAKFQIPNKNYPTTNWFGGHLYPGERSITTFTIENPTDHVLNLEIKPETLTLIKKSEFHGETKIQQQDPVLNKSGVYAPNYIRLSDVKEHTTLSSFFDDSNPIPSDASLLVLNVNFPFETFMNKTNDIYADDMRISSLYAYDWSDNDDNFSISSDELSMINRGGSWGTVQEIRISEPNSKFENIPIVGIYPVPTRYSFWIGDTQLNATSMDYILTSSYYKKEKWEPIWISDNQIHVPPNSTLDVSATIVVPLNYPSGVYQGFLLFEGQQHNVNVPVSFAVKKKIDQKDSLVLISEQKSDDVMYGNGFIRGAFDMSNRYMAGDWRQYYFDIVDDSINAASIDISWKSKNTNIAAFVIDPEGKIIQTNVPSGVLGHFQDWPTNDWLGISPFSQGGGFFPVKNKDDTSTVLFAPINKTGTYGILVHSTLFGGESITEPISVAAKFSTIVHDNKEPEIILSLPEFINNNFEITPTIKDEHLDYTKYFLDGNEIVYNSTYPINSNLEEGSHKLDIFAIDTVGHNTTKSFSFNIDNFVPNIVVKSPKNETTLSGILPIVFEISEPNLPESDFTTIILPNGEIVKDMNSIEFDTSQLEEGDYEIKISVNDKADNKATKTISFTVDNNAKPISFVSTDKEEFDGNFLLIIGIAIGIAIGAGSIIATRKIKISQKH